MITNFTTSSIKSGVKRKRFWDQITSTNAFESIATVTVGAGGASYIDFTDIPQTYSHLQIRGTLGATAANNPYIRFNSDTSNSYSWHHMYSAGSSVGNNAGVNYGFCYMHYLAGTGFGGIIVMDILDYKNTNKYKTLKTLAGFENNSAREVALWGGAWYSNSAITSLRIAPGTGSFSQYTSLSLYGIKA